MSDNFLITEGSGTRIQSDEVSRNSISGHMQIVKIAAGAEGDSGALVSTTDPMPVGGQAVAAGGCSIFRTLDLNCTGQVVKASAGQVYGIEVSNLSNAYRFLKLYDKATAATEADTPVITAPIDAASSKQLTFPTGLAFASGIGVRASVLLADNNTGGPGTNDVVLNLFYK